MKKILLSGTVGLDFSAVDIIRQLDASKGDNIEVHLASPGGSVFDGIEIFNAFRDYKRNHPNAQMLLTIKGLAASMASYISANLAFDKVAAEDNAVLMIHNPSGGSVGDYRDMEKMQEILSGLADVLAQAYAAKVRKPVSIIRQLMDNETWYFGRELLDAGFVSEILTTNAAKDKAGAIAAAKTNFNTMSAKFQGKKEDVMKIAALIKTPSPVTLDPAVVAFYADINRVRGQLGMLPIPESEWPETIYAREQSLLSDSYKATGVIATNADYSHWIKKTKAQLGQTV